MSSPALNPGDGILADAPYRVAAVTLVVNNLAEVARFYRDALGLAPISQEPDTVRLGVGDTVLLALRADPAARLRSPREAGLFHTAFLLPTRADLGAWLRHADASGLDLTGAADHLVSEAVYLTDPEGNGIEIYVDRPAADWQRGDDGSVVMRNERLDHTGIVAVADRPWAGLPAGSCVGHVHLQVGELDATERFYAGLLGFEVMCRYPGALFLGSGGYHHQLAGNVWNSRGASVRADGTTGLAEVALFADGATAERVQRRVRDAGLPSVEDGEALVLRDPWRTQFRLMPDGGRLAVGEPRWIGRDQE